MGVTPPERSAPAGGTHARVRPRFALMLHESSSGEDAARAAISMRALQAHKFRPFA